MKLQPPNLMDKFCTTTNEFCNTYKNFFAQNLKYLIIYLCLYVGFFAIQ